MALACSCDSVFHAHVHEFALLCWNESVPVTCSGRVCGAFPLKSKKMIVSKGLSNANLTERFVLTRSSREALTSTNSVSR